MTLYRYKPQLLVVLVIDQCRLQLARAGKHHSVPNVQNDGHNEKRSKVVKPTQNDFFY